MSDVELRHLRFGFIPLNDSAPLIVAREQGFFETEGLSVDLSREASWANVRDKVAAGALDGAHMLGPMALAASIGVGGERTPMTAPMALNLNGSAITLSKIVMEAMRAIDPVGMAVHPRTARPLARLIDARRALGERPLTFAVVFPYSMHNYMLRYWMAEGGIDPDADIRLVVTPPSRMAEKLCSGEIDGFCVSAPWNALAVSEGGGEVLVHASEFWNLGPDKVLGVTRAFADRSPKALNAVVRALLKAAAWADDPANRPALAVLLARRAYIDAPRDVVAQSLPGAAAHPARQPDPGPPDCLIYHRYAANFPWRSHALWFLTQMRRWGQIGAEVDIAAVAEAVYRPDLFRAAAAGLGEAAPAADDKVEGGHGRPWVLAQAGAPIPMAPDLMFDGRVFDPRHLDRYERSFAVSRFRP